MHTINHAAQCVHGLALVTALVILAGPPVFAATNEAHQPPAWREAVSARDSKDETQPHRIVDIHDPGDGTPGMILFGEVTNAYPASTRRGPR